MPLSRKTLVKVKLVNWLPWSVLQISGLPYFAKASFPGLQRKNPCPWCWKASRTNFSAVPVHNGHQVQEAFAHGDEGYIRAPDLIGSGNGQTPQQMVKLSYLSEF